MQIQENVLLAPYTTLRIGGPARYFCEAKSVEELKEALLFAKEKKLPVFILGGGSNILISNEGFGGLVVRVLIKGKEIIGKDIDEVRIEVGAGEVLDEVIAWSIENKWWGMENLSFIPGLVGALVIQNVGAYGAEASRIVESVRVLDRNDATIKQFNNADCVFGYRSSIFNSSQKNRFVILSVVLKLLTSSGEPNLKYIDVRKYFAKKGILHPSLGQMREAIVAIRKRKGQDPQEHWSAGSFFSNVRLSQNEFDALCEKIKITHGVLLADELMEIKNKFFEPNAKIKIPTAFLLDRVLGLKGKIFGGAKLSELQVINIVNTGSATAGDVLALSDDVKKIVFEKLGVTLSNEPELVGFDN